MGDRDFLDKMLREFIAHVPAQIQVLRGSVENGDAQTLEGVAHSLKGAAKNLSAKGIASVALRLEQMGREGDLTQARQVLGDLEGKAERLREYISQSEW